MVSIMKINSPLGVPVGRKNFTLNLNVYRNAHYQILNKAKQNYKIFMSRQIFELPKFEKIEVEFVVYPKTARKFDIANVCSIHDKFFLDALVYYKKIEDDNFNFVTKSIYNFGKKDAENPRVEIFIKEIE